MTSPKMTSQQALVELQLTAAAGKPTSTEAVEVVAQYVAELEWRQMTLVTALRHVGARDVVIDAILSAPAQDGAVS